MYYSDASAYQLVQGASIPEVALDDVDALSRQVSRFEVGPGQCAYAITLLQQLRAQYLADKSRGAGNGDDTAARDQADATLRRNSSATASRFSGAWELMKSRRALARDSLPDEVLGRERGGTSST